MLKLIAISTTFVAAVVALAIVVAVVGVFFVHIGGDSGHVVTTP